MNIGPQLSLTELQHAFAQWRQTRQPRYVPDELRQQALGLLSRHSRTELTRALGINYSMLKRWQVRRSDESVSSAFVELSAAMSNENTALTLAQTEARVLLKLSVRREAEALTVSGELSVAQWRAALSLLEPER
jgi:hypothetical protein